MIIKETDWITIDINKPQTFPNEDVKVIIMLNLANRPDYQNIRVPYIASAFSYFKEDNPRWNFELPEEVHSGDKYAVVNWYELEDEWVKVNMSKDTTLPKEGTLCIIENLDGLWIGRIYKHDVYDNAPDYSADMMHWGDANDSEDMLSLVIDGDKWIELEIEGYETKYN
jgi:hypothetical protein